MKNQIYFFILGFIIVMSFALLFLYFTQDFTESLLVEDEIPFWEIQLTTHNSTNIEYLDSATLEIGKLEIENNGIFPQQYEFPKIIGCINIINTNKQTSFFEEKMYFDFYENSIPLTFNSDRFKYRDEERIEIKTNKKRTFDIIGTFNSRRPISYFYEPEIPSISVFILEPKANSMFESSARNQMIYTDCKTLFATLEPYKTIILT